MKRNEKHTEYRQLAFELLARSAGCKIDTVPLIIRALGGSIK